MGWMAILQLCHWKFWHKEAYLIWRKLHFIKKNKTSLFEPPFGRFSDNVCTQSIARWKACGRLCIHRNWTFFAISYGWNVISRNLSKSACFERGLVTFEHKFHTEGALSTNHCWCQQTRVTALLCGIKISAVHCLVSSQSTHVTTTDWQNYDS